MYKYSLLLKKETDHLAPNWLELALHDAIQTNMDLAANKVQLDGEESKKEKSSFYQSTSIGISTLACLNLLKDEESVRDNFSRINFLIQSEIIDHGLHLGENDSSLFEGASGYLYSLLVIEKALKQHLNTYTEVVMKLHTALHNAITKTVRQIMVNFGANTK